jgi:membrane protease YdiL (CAAX protease family)
MSQVPAISSASPPVSAPPARKGRPLVAWLVILAIIGLILWRNEEESSRESARYDLLVMRLQGRYLVGLDHLPMGPPLGNDMRQKLYEEAQKSINRGPYTQRLRFIALAGELVGPKEALAQLRQLNERYHSLHGEPPKEDARTAAILEDFYVKRVVDPNAVPSLPQEEQRLLRERLGWFGELALNPPEEGDAAAREAVLAPAKRTAASLVAFFGVLLSLGLLGLLILITLAILWFLGILRGGLRCGSPYGGVYAETFALYMVLYIGLSYAMRYVMTGLSLTHGRLALSGLAALGSLVALGWPVLRGVPWRQVCAEIGWRKGRHPLLEPFLGIVCYAMALPMLLVGLLLMLGMTKLRDQFGAAPDEFSPVNTPGHPIVFWVANASWWVWLEVLFVACIVAPIVEETMFRGVLHRHLREASCRLRPALSVGFSALVVSFLFAVIHPQGFLAVPVLMSLALAFALVREWRGTLIPSMIAHGLNNGIATLLLFVLMS